MTRKVILVLVAASAVALGGCVASPVAGAAGMAVRAAQKPPQSNAHLQTTAKKACSDSAVRYGAVHVIDVVQRSAARIVVWGSVDHGKQRQSFECGFRTAITYFKQRKYPR